MKSKSTYLITIGVFSGLVGGYIGVKSFQKNQRQKQLKQLLQQAKQQLVSDAPIVGSYLNQQATTELEPLITGGIITQSDPSKRQIHHFEINLKTQEIQFI